MEKIIDILYNIETISQDNINTVNILRRILGIDSSAGFSIEDILNPNGSLNTEYLNKHGREIKDFEELLYNVEAGIIIFQRNSAILSKQSKELSDKIGQL